MADPPKRPPVKLFYSYADEDEALRDQLNAHLSSLERDGLVEGWHDRRIIAGQRYIDVQIDEKLDAADVILLLVSSEFIASDYCQSREMARAIERWQMKGAAVIPIILRSCRWIGQPFKDLPAAPRDALPVKNWSNCDDAWVDVVETIERASPGGPSLVRAAVRWPRRRRRSTGGHRADAPGDRRAPPEPPDRPHPTGGRRGPRPPHAIPEFPRRGRRRCRRCGSRPGGADRRGHEEDRTRRRRRDDRDRSNR